MTSDLFKKVSADDWFFSLDYERLESITKIRQSDFDNEDDFLWECWGWWTKLDNDEKYDTMRYAHVELADTQN